MELGKWKEILPRTRILGIGIVHKALGTVRGTQDRHSPPREAMEHFSTIKYTEYNRMNGTLYGRMYCVLLASKFLFDCKYAARIPSTSIPSSSLFSIFLIRILFRVSDTVLSRGGVRQRSMQVEIEKRDDTSRLGSECGVPGNVLIGRPGAPCANTSEYEAITFKAYIHISSLGKQWRPFACFPC